MGTYKKLVVVNFYDRFACIHTSFHDLFLFLCRSQIICYGQKIYKRTFKQLLTEG